MMTDTTIAEAAEPAATLSGMPRLLGEIDPANVQLQLDGMCFREWVIRLPEMAIFADLNEPRIWARVQATKRTAVAKHDRVRIVAHDESWCVETIVAGATREGVTLSKMTRYDLDPRTEILAGDDKYQIRWTNGAYRVQRRSDGQFMTNGVQTQQQAERDLRNLYPQQANYRP
jgi:hypothetical protein